MSEKLTMSPKEFGARINRSAEWVCDLIRAGTIATLPPHSRPYLIPASALEKFLNAATRKRVSRAA